MKKAILFSCFFLLFLFNGKAQITIHTNQVERFHELMKYLEEKAGGKLYCKYANETELQAAYRKDASDFKQNALIDSLLTQLAVFFPKKASKIPKLGTDKNVYN